MASKLKFQINDDVPWQAQYMAQAEPPNVYYPTAPPLIKKIPTLQKSTFGFARRKVSLPYYVQSDF